MLSLNQIKKHLNIDENYNGDDEYLQQLNRVADEVVEKHINRSLYDIKAENKGELPSALEQAILLLIANFYANREPITYTSATELPISYNYILDLYKCYYNPNNK